MTENRSALTSDSAGALSAARWAHSRAGLRRHYDQTLRRVSALTDVEVRDLRTARDGREERPVTQDEAASERA